jgi:hypothetical protein
MDEDEAHWKKFQLERIVDEIWKLVSEIRGEFDQNITVQDETKLLEIEGAISSALQLPMRGN